jgi:G3E family GTPase
MLEIIEKFNPERIIVEPSGVGKLSDIINAINSLEVEVKLNILATVVDGAKAKIYLKNFGEFFINQVDSADSVIINKIDKMSDEKLLEVVEIVRDKNPHANIITTPINELSGAKLLELLESKVSLKDELMKELEEEHHHEHDHECCCHHHDEEEHECHCGHHHEEEHECHCGCHSHGESEYGITTFVYYIRDGFNRKKFMNFVENFDKSIIRCKGVLYFEDEDNMSYLFEQAGRQKTLMEAGEWFCVLPKEESDKLRQIEPKLEKDWDEKYGDRMVKLVFIGQHMDKDKIISDLDKCV